MAKEKNHSLSSIDKENDSIRNLMSKGLKFTRISFEIQRKSITFALY